MNSSAIQTIEVKTKNPSNVAKNAARSAIVRWNSSLLDKSVKTVPYVLAEMERAVNFCSQGGWSSPFRCAKNGSPELSTSRWCKFMQYTILSTSILGTASQIFTIIVDMQRRHFSFYSLTGPYRLMCALVFSFITIVQINLKWKSSEVLETWRSLLNYIERYHSEDSEGLKRIDKRCQMLMKMFIVNFTLMPIFGSILFLYRCEFHILSTVLPICDVGNGGGHKSITTILFSLGIMFIVSSPGITCMAITSFVILVYIFMGQFALRNLKFEASQNQPNHLRSSKWNTSYRCFSMLNSRRYDCFGEVVDPSYFCLSTLIIIMSNYLILTPNVALLVKCLAIPVCTAFVLYMFLVIQFEMFFPDVSADSLILKKGQCISRNTYTSRFLNSCPPIRIYVRHFLYLTKDIIPIIVGIIITQTISLYLA